MVLIERSVETPRSPSIATRNLAGLTSKRSQISNVQYPRIPSKILKGASNEEVVNDVVAGVAMLGLVDDKAVNPLILNIWSVETPRYPA
jgi:hypothetical protein